MEAHLRTTAWFKHSAYHPVAGYLQWSLIGFVPYSVVMHISYWLQWNSRIYCTLLLTVLEWPLFLWDFLVELELLEVLPPLTMYPPSSRWYSCMTQLVLNPLKGSPVQKMNVFFRPTLQSLLVTVSSAPMGLQYPLGEVLPCAAWLNRYHWFPACSALPWKISYYKYTIFTVRTSGEMDESANHSVPMDHSGAEALWGWCQGGMGGWRLCDGENEQQDLHLKGRSGNQEVG